ncbi:MAG TPA: class I SAM-dependent methyltransferase [Gemmatimonadaceae bacterium]|nr:class I SAM-dependent methyltransferase [Gemmatimonadaceae bacterium]
MPTFRDHFAFAASSYASYRPRYPAALFAWLASETPGHERAWDCGTGSGQAAVGLAPHYGMVVATDPSQAQLASAARARGVEYVAMSAEASALRGASLALVTVAQALHWFDRARFFDEVDRVLCPGGLLAVWSYGLLTIEPAIDAQLHHFYSDTLGGYWPSERALVDTGYAGIALPYPELSTPRVAMEASWTLAQVLGFLSTWSAVGRYRMAVEADPLRELSNELASAWGTTTERRLVRWPLTLRAARKRM